jgi:DNA-binding beta-propeller fold protein YncE
MKLATGRSPVGVAFDPCTGRLFVANADDGSISVIRCPIPVANRSGDLERIPTLARGRLIIPAPHSGQLLDITGRVVLALRSGLNDVSRLSPGVYFVREAQAVRKVVITR